MPKLAFRILLVPAFAPLLAAPLQAAHPRLEKYPLRVHILAADDTREVPRMGPAESVVCDTIDDMLSSISPDPGGPVTLSGVSADPCALHAPVVAGRFLDINTTERVYAGQGRADLVSPPDMTQGFSFNYDNCGRVRVLSGFHSLPARWKKHGQKLEVLVPSDEIPVGGTPLPPLRCSLTVTLHDFVYLLLRNGRVIEVSQEDYWKKPALRVFLSGTTPTVQQRLQQHTVSAKPISPQ